MATTGASVLAFLGQPATDATQLGIANAAVASVSAMVAAYCRDNHRKASGTLKAGVDEVILTASARLTANPEGLRYNLGSVGFQSAFTGFTLPELAVLNRYRRKAA